MLEFSIYCTEEQTKKALELGAPIDSGNDINIYNNKEDTNLLYRLPTAEQMIGWLEEQDEIFTIVIALLEGYWQGFVETTNYKDAIFKDGYKTRKEATLAAIDAALDYLTNKNK